MDCKSSLLPFIRSHWMDNKLSIWYSAPLIGMEDFWQESIHGSWNAWKLEGVGSLTPCSKFICFSVCLAISPYIERRSSWLMHGEPASHKTALRDSDIGPSGFSFSSTSLMRQICYHCFFVWVLLRFVKQGGCMVYVVCVFLVCNNSLGCHANCQCLCNEISSWE